MTLVATYDYESANGTLLAQKLRYEDYSTGKKKKSFKQRVPDGSGDFAWGALPANERVLYRLPSIIAADELFIVAGERDSDTLVSCGLCATTGPDGESTPWIDENGIRAPYVEALRGKHCVLIPDTDIPGRKHADNVVAALDGLAKSVAIVWLPHSKDVTEWFENGGTTEELNTLIETAKLPENAPLKSFGKLLRKKGEPAAKESEEVVLGAVLDGRAGAEFSDIEILSVDEFYITKHRIIFQALQRLHYEVGTTDIKACTQYLEEKEQLDAVGGITGLLDLIEDLPASFNIDAHIEVIQNKAKARLLMDGAIKVAQKLLLGGSPEEAREDLNQCTDRSLAVSSKLAISSAADISKDVEAFISKREAGIMCKTMPDLMGNFYGLRKKDLLLFAGKPGSGKSAFSNLLCASAALQGYQVDMISLEIGKEDTLLKMCCAIAQVPFMDVITGDITPSQKSRLEMWVKKFQALPLNIDDKSGWSIPKLRNMLKEKRAAGMPTRVLCLDYLQLMPSTSKHSRRDLELAEVTAGMKLLAKEFELTAILLSQMNRRGDQGTQGKKDGKETVSEPQLSDLRDTGGAEADPDVVGFIVQHTKDDNQYDYERNATVFLKKSRIGGTQNFPMKFSKRFMLFYEAGSGFKIDYSAAYA